MLTRWSVIAGSSSLAHVQNSPPKPTPFPSHHGGPYSFPYAPPMFHTHGLPPYINAPTQNNASCTAYSAQHLPPPHSALPHLRGWSPHMYSVPYSWYPPTYYPPYPPQAPMTPASTITSAFTDEDSKTAWNQLSPTQTPVRSASTTSPVSIKEENKVLAGKLSQRSTFQ